MKKVFIYQLTDKDCYLTGETITVTYHISDDGKITPIKYSMLPAISEMIKSWHVTNTNIRAAAIQNALQTA